MFRFAVLAFLACASATVKVNAPCPAVKVIDDFDPKEFGTGTWYETARYPNAAEKNGDCGYAKYTQNSDGYIIQNFHVDNGKLKEIQGTARPAYPGTSIGQMIVTHPYGPNRSLFSNTMNVLAGDNKNFAVMYYCKYNEATQSREDFAWVLSRSKTMEGKTKAAFEDFLAKSEIIDKSKLIFNNFTEEACKLY